MYTIEDVTNRYSADHVTTLGAAAFPSPKPDEIYLINGMNNFDTSPSQIIVMDSMGSSPKSVAVAPKERRAIGTGNYTNLKRRRRTSGLSGLAAPQSDLGFVKVNIPGIELDENVETAIGGLSALVAAGLGLWGLSFVWRPIMRIIEDGRKAARSFD